MKIIKTYPLRYETDRLGHVTLFNTDRDEHLEDWDTYNKSVIVASIYVQGEDGHRLGEELDNATEEQQQQIMENYWL